MGLRTLSPIVSAYRVWDTFLSYTHVHRVKQQMNVIVGWYKESRTSADGTDAVGDWESSKNIFILICPVFTRKKIGCVQFFFLIHHTFFCDFKIELISVRLYNVDILLTETRRSKGSLFEICALRRGFRRSLTLILQRSVYFEGLMVMWPNA